jgi:hypothetical protein
LFLEADAFFGRDGEFGLTGKDTAFAAGHAVGLQEKTAILWDIVMLAGE